ncbi:hypothetical protein [Epibacterium ulvae]|uniref:Uncharacterized protein n=1 Tax=Epibacterium ulvae TaxID=1156985 RepID=A0A1G5PKZ3_9RHOB|nr:hypothetical protein [Epibacterium ulvae]SCZ50205.1 hypothetical protein SAMN04488118_101241 [Epibacterium ulvae]
MEDPVNTINELCAVSAKEMRDLQQKVQILEDVVFTVFERGTKPTSKEFQALQDFDLVSQTLAGMSQFYDRVGELAEETGTADLVQASEALTLEKLRNRLSSNA